MHKIELNADYLRPVDRHSRESGATSSFDNLVKYLKGHKDQKIQIVVKPRTKVDFEDIFVDSDSVSNDSHNDFVDAALEEDLGDDSDHDSDHDSDEELDNASDNGSDDSSDEEAPSFKIPSSLKRSSSDLPAPEEWEAVSRRFGTIPLTNLLANHKDSISVAYRQTAAHLEPLRMNGEHEIGMRNVISKKGGKKVSSWRVDTKQNVRRGDEWLDLPAPEGELQPLTVPGAPFD